MLPRTPEPQLRHLSSVVSGAYVSKCNEADAPLTFFLERYGCLSVDTVATLSRWPGFEENPAEKAALLYFCSLCLWLK